MVVEQGPQMPRAPRENPLRRGVDGCAMVLGKTALVFAGFGGAEYGFHQIPHDIQQNGWLHASADLAGALIGYAIGRVLIRRRNR